MSAWDIQGSLRPTNEELMKSIAILGPNHLRKQRVYPVYPKMARIHTISDLVDLSSCKLNYLLRQISSFLALWMIKTNA